MNATTHVTKGRAERIGLSAKWGLKSLFTCQTDLQNVLQTRFPRVVVPSLIESILFHVPCMKHTIVRWRFAAHEAERSSFSTGLARIFRDDDGAVGGVVVWYPNSN